MITDSAAGISIEVVYLSLQFTRQRDIITDVVHALVLAGGRGIEPWLADATELLGAEPDDNVRQALVGLQEMVKGELSGSDITLVLLLPADDAPLAERAKALGQWCQGFLDGFGIVVGNAPLSAEAMEVLQDLSAIAQVQSGLEESEDGESDYMEVMEYLRVAPLLLFAECGKPAAPAPKPSLH